MSLGFVDSVPEDSLIARNRFTPEVGSFLIVRACRLIMAGNRSSTGSEKSDQSVAALFKMILTQSSLGPGSLIDAVVLSMPDQLGSFVSSYSSTKFAPAPSSHNESFISSADLLVLTPLICPLEPALTQSPFIVTSLAKRKLELSATDTASFGVKLICGVEDSNVFRNSSGKDCNEWTMGRPDGESLMIMWACRSCRLNAALA